MSFFLLTLLFVAVEAGRPDPESLAGKIDDHISEGLLAAKVAPAPESDDGEFLRRASLDLIGCIPTASEARAFIADREPQKRGKLIDRLLASRQHVEHLARTWRSLLIPEAETEPQLRYFETGFEAWLSERLEPGAGFDRVARELLSAPITGPGEAPQPVLRDLSLPNPYGFFAAKNAEPAKIAAGAVRVFLGLRLECAECHDHPYDDWTQEQFWSQAAFFAGIEQRGKGPFAPLTEDRARRSIASDPSKPPIAAALLPSDLLSEGTADRDDFACWISSPENPYFARAIANRVWSQLMGRGIVEPVDDFSALNPASHAELLQTLGDAFTASGHDLAVLQSAICRSQTYGRTSRQTDPSQGAATTFARMPVRPMTSEQYYASVALAIGHEPPENHVPGEPVTDRVRAAMKKIVADATPTGDPQTSVAQALALMNGDVIHRAANGRKSARLQQIVEAHPDSPQQQIEELFLTTLTRFPTADEQRSLERLFAGADPREHQQLLGDVFWALLNLPEFRWNH